jgi:hypothetical protein
MNKKRPIPEVVVWVSFHSSTTCDIVFFLFIHNLWYWSLFIHPQPLVWVYFLSSTTSGMGLFLFIHNLWNRSLFIHDLFLRLWMNKKRPIPDVFDEKKEAYSRGCG